MPGIRTCGLASCCRTGEACMRPMSVAVFFTLFLLACTSFRPSSTWHGAKGAPLPSAARTSGCFSLLPTLRCLRRYGRCDVSLHFTLVFSGHACTMDGYMQTMQCVHPCCHASQQVQYSSMHSPHIQYVRTHVTQQSLIAGTTGFSGVCLVS
jgi:hypothetical protein